MITITLRDLPDGNVLIHSSHMPQIGARTTPSECLAMDMLNASQKTSRVFFGPIDALPPGTQERYAEALQQAQVAETSQQAYPLAHKVDRSHPYTPAVMTDVRKTFADARRTQAADTPDEQASEVRA